MKPIPVQEELSKEKPFKISVFESDRLTDPFHFHTGEYELTLTIGGSGIRLTGDHIGEFDDIDLVLTGPGIPHCWLNNFTNEYNEGEQERIQKNIMVVVIHFNKNLFTGELLQKKELYPVRQLLELSQRGVYFKGDTREEVKEDILGLKIDTDFGTIIDIYSIFHKLSKSEEYDLLASADYKYKGKAGELDKFERVNDYIFHHFREKIRIGDVADLADMNESAFSHYFKKRTSKSFTEFVNELRLNYAANQLTITDKNIAEIGFESGFTNLSNFNRIFKKWKKITPNQWRKRTQPILN